MSYVAKIKKLLATEDEHSINTAILLLQSLEEASMAEVFKPLSYVEETIFPPKAFRKHASVYVDLLARYSKFDKEIADFCTSITKISMAKFGADSDLTPFVNLKKLMLYRVEEGADLTVLSRMKTLEELELVRVLEEDLQFLKGLQNLRSLTITSWPKLSNVDVLHNHPSLVSLRIVACPQLHGSTVFESIPNLKTLQVFGSPNAKIPTSFC